MAAGEESSGHAFKAVRYHFKSLRVATRGRQTFRSNTGLSIQKAIVIIDAEDDDLSQHSSSPYLDSQKKRSTERWRTREASRRERVRGECLEGGALKRLRKRWAGRAKAGWGKVGPRHFPSWFDLAIGKPTKRWCRFRIINEGPTREHNGYLGKQDRPITILETVRLWPSTVPGGLSKAPQNG